MLIAHIILAAIAVGAIALAPRGSRSALIVVAAAALDLALGARAASALAVVAPLTAFLTAALTLAALVERSGLAERAAAALAGRARGSAVTLYVLVCVVCALLTAAISLDGAVVLMVPLLLALARRFEAPFAPLFLGSVVVANAASIAVPQGNPTNLVVMERLGLSAAAFTGHMLVPGLAAAAVCALGVAMSERRGLGATVQAPTAARTPLSAAERHAALALCGAAAVAWAAPLAGLAPWWPFSGAVALALLARRARLIVPWRPMAQVAGLVVVIGPLGLHPSVSGTLTLPGLVAVAVGFGASSALANNLPVSVCAAGVLGSVGPAYAATIGLAVGSLATPQGSVATLIATELAGPSAPPMRIRGFAPLAAAGMLTATALLWLNL
jgi:arsenical pump membrane protein